MCTCTWQVKELIAREWLSDPEVQAWEYLLILESYYPLQSYEEAHALHCKHHPRLGGEETTFLNSLSLATLNTVISKNTYTHGG